ncbi:MAG: pirin family protein [Polaribacter sp.]|jgi:redox-sensitive bicupin YhaK (pirin superfamily)|nr:pirin family protein [Polaribacter sp.]MDG1953442.1 pirin family protein [Polaribacter sp.]MDG2074277.1 pirin family protein [Polaribacter sp.]
MKTYKSIKHLGESPLVNMGPIKLRQPIPTNEVENVDPFLLLHHYGPYAISEFSNPFDLGPHPHRGFEPITLLFQGEQLHRDSLGNESVVKSGDAQWTTAGRGIIHAEGPTKEFVKKGGDLEGIQLWLNLPAKYKMITPAYQHAKSDEMPIIKDASGNIKLKVVAGEQQKKFGKIKTQTSVNVFMIEANGKGDLEIDIPTTHESCVYLLDGEVKINDEETLFKGESQMAVFNTDGNTIKIETAKKSKLIVVSGEPIKEKVAQYGPYVMNTQTELLEAMRDYQDGKMGHLY